MRSHIDTVGWILIVFGIFNFVMILLISGLMLFGGGFIAIIGAGSGDSEAAVVGGVYAVMAVFVLGVGVLTSIPGILAGRGLHRRRPWARILAIVLAFFSLTSCPGLFIGIYTLVTLLDGEVADEFAAMAG